MKLDSHFASSTKINSKWFKDLYVKCETEENIASTWGDIGMDKEYKNKSPASQNIRCAANEWEDPNILKFP